MKKLLILALLLVSYSAYSQDDPKQDAVSNVTFGSMVSDFFDANFINYAIYPEKEYLECITDTIEIQMTADTKGKVTYKILKSNYPAFTKAVDDAFARVPKDRMRYGPVYSLDNKKVINTEIVKFVFNDKNIPPCNEKLCYA